MKIIIPFLLLLLLLLLRVISQAAAVADPYNATDYILLDCGAPSKQLDDNQRSWDSDERSKYAPPDSVAISNSSTASQQHSSVTQVPYLTARVFTSNFTYTFPLLAGPKFLRLYFYPGMFSSYNTSEYFFTVTANAFTLLKNFSASLNSSPYNPAFSKEFIFNVDVDQRLNLTFIPNPESFAFVNGIEIVSAPEMLYFRGNDQPLKTNSDQVFYLTSDRALEKLYRLNVGGNDIEVQNDTGMFRAWNQDDPYIFGADYGYTPHYDNASIMYNSRTPDYTAPETVYTTSRVTANTSISLEWAFPVDSGFKYLFRLHFCEIQQEVTKKNQRVFDIAIDGASVDMQVDIIFWTGGNDIPIFMDYVAVVPDDGSRGRRDLRLSLTPDKMSQPEYYSAVLNGLEILKISDSDHRSLAAANPEPSGADRSTPETETNSVTKKSKSSPSSYAVIASVIAVVVVAAVVSFFVLRRRRRVKGSVHNSFPKSSWVPLSTASRSTTKTAGSGLSLPSDLCRHFLLEEIKSATNNFDDTFVIGKGGFGNVYKGYIDTNAGATATVVAIKRLNPSSNQGAREFQTEIEMLSKLRHLHLVSLIGYCDENGEMILVYDYMSHGTLRDHLYNSENPPLKWIDRLKICIGAAKGLHYLHTGTKHPIIHRDVKSTNILLDEKWVAKVSDFGLSKVGPTGGGLSHVSTVVKGSFGYVDPEYYRRRQLTDKSDVYSFGVVLVEVLCGRPAILPKLPREQVNLAEWAKFCYEKGILDKIIDINLRSMISSACLNKYIETVMICLRDKGTERPVMSDVAWSLEFALQLQEAAENDGGVSQLSSPSYPLLKKGDANTTDEEEIFSGCGQDASGSKSTNLSTASSELLKSGDIFSEIKNPSGR